MVEQGRGGIRGVHARGCVGVIVQHCVSSREDLRANVRDEQCMKTWESIRYLGKGIPVREYVWNKSPKACLRHITEARVGDREKGRRGKKPKR